MMDEQEFKKHADHALNSVTRAMMSAGDDFDFEVDSQAGAVTVEFVDPPAKFVISPNTPVRQIWVSALSRSFKLEWDVVQSAFVHRESGESLMKLMGTVISKHLGQEVTL